MPDKICPNINNCRMVATNDVVPDEKKKEQFINEWCRKTEVVWKECKRFETKRELGFCPDFVVPDTVLSIDEIVDKIEETQ
ncbi:MAG: hypothetical protein KAR09_00750 [Bacteroidales bacterium]|nr:hypothetical protein [Bacteroidales bacterium]